MEVGVHLRWTSDVEPAEKWHEESSTKELTAVRIGNLALPSVVVKGEPRAFPQLALQ